MTTGVIRNDETQHTHNCNGQAKSAHIYALLVSCGNRNGKYEQ